MNRLARAGTLAFFAAAGSAGAQDFADCSLALAFALDISVSVDDAEYRMQREGLAMALTDPQVVDAIRSQPGLVALMAYEWSGSHQQTVIVAWRSIHDAAGLLAFAADLVDHPRNDAEFPTALGNAIGFGTTMLNAMPTCRRLVFDVSGDGANNDGYPPESAYKAFQVGGVTVNGLVIEGAESDVLTYYLEHVIRGPAAFVEIAHGYKDYANAMRRKLLREVQQPQFVENR